MDGQRISKLYRISLRRRELGLMSTACKNIVNS